MKFEMWLALFYVNSLHFQQWNWNWNIGSVNSSLDSKFGFLNVGLELYLTLFPNSPKDWKLGFFKVARAGLFNLFQFMKENEILEFFNVSLDCTFKFLPIPKLEFWILLTFIFCQIVKIVFQAWYMSRRGEANLWLNCQFLRKWMFMFLQ